MLALISAGRNIKQLAETVDEFINHFYRMPKREDILYDPVLRTCVGGMKVGLHWFNVNLYPKGKLKITDYFDMIALGASEYPKQVLALAEQSSCAGIFRYTGAPNRNREYLSRLRTGTDG